MHSDGDADTVLISDRLLSRRPEIVRSLTASLESLDIPLVTVSGTADIWIRDAAPVQVGDGEFVQFVYRPDYLRNGYEHLITPPGVFTGLPFVGRLSRSELVIDGGNVVGRGKIVVLTDKVFRENPSRSRREIEDELRRLLRADRVVFLPKEPYDTIGHADGMVRFLDESTVVANDYSAVDPKFGRRFLACLERHGLNVTTLPYRPERYRVDGIDSAAGNYVNFIRVGDLFLVPSYDMPEDVEAAETLRRLCPNSTVIPIPSLNLAREGGVLQCVTWTVRIGERTA